MTTHDEQKERAMLLSDLATEYSHALREDELLDLTCYNLTTEELQSMVQTVKILLLIDFFYENDPAFRKHVDKLDREVFTEEQLEELARLRRKKPA